jgi:hypothetical protein
MRVSAADVVVSHCWTRRSIRTTGHRSCIGPVRTARFDVGRSSKIGELSSFSSWKASFHIAAIDTIETTSRHGSCKDSAPPVIPSHQRPQRVTSVYYPRRFVPTAALKSPVIAVAADMAKSSESAVRSVDKSRILKPPSLTDTVRKVDMGLVRRLRSVTLQYRRIHQVGLMSLMRGFR